MKTLKHFRNKTFFEKNKKIKTNNNNNDIDNNNINNNNENNNIENSNCVVSTDVNNNNNSEENKDLGTPTQYSNIHSIDWLKLSNIEKLNLGDSNQFYIATFEKDDNKNEYNQVLLKSSTTIVQEIYASVLEIMLQLPVPQTRLLEFSNEEFTQMSKSLLECSDNISNELNETIKNELIKSYFLIMEYRPDGKSFGQLNHKEYFSGSSGEKKLNQLGQIIAFDILINNSDRLPIIWDNISNHFSNIIFYDTPPLNPDGSKGIWYFSLISSNVTCINNSSFTVGYKKYCSRLKSLLYSIFKNPSLECNQIKKMRENIAKTYNINLSSSSVNYIHLQKGLITGIQLIVNNISYTILKDTKSKLQNLVKVDSKWKKGVDSIYTPFLFDVLQIFNNN